MHQSLSALGFVIHQSHSECGNWHLNWLSQKVNRSDVSMSCSALNKPLYTHDYGPDKTPQGDCDLKTLNGPIFTTITCYSVKIRNKEKSRAQPAHPSKTYCDFEHREPLFQVPLVWEVGNIFRSKGRSVHLRDLKETPWKPKILWCWSVICTHDTVLRAATGKTFYHYHNAKPLSCYFAKPMPLMWKLSASVWNPECVKWCAEEHRRSIQSNSNTTSHRLPC